MIGVAALPVGKNDHAWTKAAEDCGDFEAVGQGIFDVAVWKVEGLTVGDVEDAGGGVCLGFAVGCCAASAGFALSEIEDAGAPPARVHGEEGSATGLFYIIAVGSDGEDVNGRHDGYGSSAV